MTLAENNGRTVFECGVPLPRGNPYRKGSKASGEFMKGYEAAKTKAVDLCEHDFQGWREIDGGLGGERFCAKCGIGAMSWSMAFLP